MRSPKFFRMFYYDHSLLPNAQLRNLEADANSIEDAKRLSGFSIGWPGWSLLYSIVLSNIPPGETALVVETGTNQGATTLVLAQALVDRGVINPRVITFEMLSENLSTARENWAKAGVSRFVRSFLGDTRDTLEPALMELVEPHSLRFVLLDASHLESDVRREFETVLPYLASDGIVAMDNTYPIAEEGEDPRVNGFLSTITERYGGNLINFPFCSWFTPGLAIWQREPDLSAMHHLP